MALYNTGANTDKLNKAIGGWTVVSVVPCTKTEAQFTLNLAMGTKRKNVDVYSTELGYWFREHSHKFVETGGPCNTKL